MRSVPAAHSIYRPLNYEPLDRLMLRIRRASGMNMIARETAPSQIVRVLRGGGVVAILTDQDARKDGIFVDFFGRPTSTLPTPAVLSFRFGAPIVPVNIYRERGRHVIIFDTPIWPDDFAAEENPSRAVTQRLAARLESFVREHPDQWFWLHLRWKTKPEPANEIRPPSSVQ